MQSSGEHRPNLFVYAVLFLVAWVGVRVLWNAVLPGGRFLFLMSISIVAISVWLISRHVAKTFQRQLFQPERWRLILYFSVWVVLQEAVVVYAYFKGVERQRSTGVGSILFVAFTSVAAYALVFWAGFTRLSPALIAAYLRKAHVPSPNISLERQ